MIRVKDKDVSLKFYQDIMGMRLQRTSENESNGFNLYFLGYMDPPSANDKTANGVNPMAWSEGLLELTWNYGTEKQEGKVYHDGNGDPQGFGHIALTVDDLDEACKRFEEKGVQFKKRLTDGRMRNVAFVLGEFVCHSIQMFDDDYETNHVRRSRWILGGNHPERKV